MIKKFTKLFEKWAVYSSFLQRIARIYYRPMVKREIELAAISENDKVLFIGGGRLPMSSILLAEQSKARIGIVDCDKGAIEGAKHFVGKMEYRFDFYHAKGEDIRVQDYDVIVVAKQVMSKQCVLNNLLDQVKPGTRVVCRVRKVDALIQKFSTTIEGKTCLINVS